MTFVDAVAKSLMAGCDFSDKEYELNIPAAVREGKLTEERLNDAVARVLRVRMRLGEFDRFEAVPYSRISPDVICSAAHRSMALEAARQSIVLLQNRDQLLPLDRTKLRRLAVIGPLANRVVLNNYCGTPGRTVRALEGIRDRAGSAVQVTYTHGTNECGENAAARIEREPGAIAGADAKLDAAGLVAEAAAAAREADAAIVFVGTDARVEQEGRDRTTLGLTGNQEDLVKAVFAANPQTVVVEMSAGPLTVPWIKEHIPAIVQAWWGGEEGGHAVADVLFGDVNPAGRLPHTVYASESQVPPQDEYDIGKGFTYMYLNGPPLFAFGHGLSYTTFAYGKLKVSAADVARGGELRVSLAVTNIGSRAGDEVVQLYIRQRQSAAQRPARQLGGFQRIYLAPGAKMTVEFSLLTERLANWNDQSHRFEIEPGVYEALVGASSDDIRQTGSFSVMP
jgi:beta-glucosidase